MTVTRINYFSSRQGNSAALYEKLNAIVPMIKNATGCLGCRILNELEDSNQILIIEEWQNIEAHKAALAEVPPETFAPVMTLLANPPHGHYYNTHSGQDTSEAPAS